MNEIERTLGRVEQKIDSHAEFEVKEHEKIESRFNGLEEKVDSLRLWRAGVIGMSGVVGALAGFLSSHAVGALTGFLSSKF